MFVGGVRLNSDPVIKIVKCRISVVGSQCGDLTIKRLGVRWLECAAAPAPVVEG